MKHFQKLPFSTLYGYLFILAPFAFAFISLPAGAHHPFEGVQDLSFPQGLMSGFAHPVLGIDHFLFLLSIGLIGRLSFAKWIPSLLFCGLVGAVISQAVPVIDGLEFFMGLSLVASAFVSLGRLTPLIMFPLILCHGYLLGQVMIGVEPTPLSAYFLGMIISEAFLILLGLNICRRFKAHRLLFSGILIGSGVSLTYGLIA